MSGLAQIRLPPPEDTGFREWLWANLDHHRAILAAMKSVKGVNQQLYRLWPVSKDNLQDFLDQHQQQHEDLCQVLGIPGSDLSSLDLGDKKKRDSWFFIHYNQHLAAASALGLGI